MLWTMCSAPSASYAANPNNPNKCSQSAWAAPLDLSEEANARKAPLILALVEVPAEAKPMAVKAEEAMAAAVKMAAATEEARAEEARVAEATAAEAKEEALAVPAAADHTTEPRPPSSLQHRSTLASEPFRGLTTATQLCPLHLGQILTLLKLFIIFNCTV